MKPGNSVQPIYVWDERYSREGWAYGDQPNDFLRSQEQLIRSGGRRTLCIGEGEGRNAIWLAQLGLEVTAIDLSPVGLKKAGERASRLGLSITTIVADLATWRFEPGAWDLIVSIFCHLPPDLRSRVHRGVVEGLAPNGLFITELYRPSQLTRGTGGPPDPILLASAEELKPDLDGLRFLHLEELSRDVIEGRYHTGIADVVQIVARKQS